jgi:hypothetical protein
MADELDGDFGSGVRAANNHYAYNFTITPMSQ